MLCCVTCVDLRHEHATHAICVSVQCTHSTSLIRVTASDGHIAGDMTGRFALHWRSDGPAHLLDLGSSGTLATSTAAGPKVFESMSPGPLTCLKLTAVWRLSIYIHTRITTRLGISCFLRPQLGKVHGTDGDWLSQIGPFSLATA